MHRGHLSQVVGVVLSRLLDWLVELAGQSRKALGFVVGPPVTIGSCGVHSECVIDAGEYQLERPAK